MDRCRISTAIGILGLCTALLGAVMWPNRAVGQPPAPPSGQPGNSAQPMPAPLEPVLINGHRAAGALHSPPSLPLTPQPHREIVINVPGMRLYVYEDGVLAREYPIGVGKIVTPSQMGGETHIANKVLYPTYYPPDWYLRGRKPIPPGPENPVGTRWLGLDLPGYGIHGTNDPSSIGKAVSAGCIRMQNRDVEELANLVDVGTAVRFLYETVLVRRDPLLGHAFLQVLPDIYELEQDPLGRALERLSTIGLTANAVETTILAHMLSEADRAWHPVPRPLRATWDQAPLSHAFWSGTLPMIPVDPIARSLGSRIALSREGAALDGVPLAGARVIAETLYAPAEEVARTLGVGWQPTAEAVFDLFPIRLWQGASPLPLRTFREAAWLDVPVVPLAQRLGVRVGWDPDRQVPVFGGKPFFGGRVIGGEPYLPHDRVGPLLGISIEWEPGSRKAEIRPAVPPAPVSGHPAPAAAQPADPASADAGAGR